MNVVNSSSGRCWSSEVYSPVPGTMDNVPSSNDYKVIFDVMFLLCTFCNIIICE
jgi:3-hydroxyisobutyrate dehydrogenase